MTDEPLEIITKKTTAVQATIDGKVCTVIFDDTNDVTIWDGDKIALRFISPDHFEDFAVLVATANEAIDACGEA